jgi:hypothetical protein
LGKDGDGIDGFSDSGDGVFGSSSSGAGVSGASRTGPGLWAYSETGEGLHTEVFSASYAVAAYNRLKNPLPVGFPGFGEVTGPGGAIYGEATYGHAGYFRGKVQVVGDHEVTGNVTTGGNHKVNGDITAIGNVHVTQTLSVDGDAQINGSLIARVDVVLGNADCAEDFTIADLAEAEPGTVMVLTDAGTLTPAATDYDTRVAGVVSGAHSYRPALILDRAEPCPDRKPIALCGKVWCKVDADVASIAVGDLLTTARTPGHAMRATDRSRAFGAVLGKALAPLPGGRGLIPILVCLQ